MLYFLVIAFIFLFVSLFVFYVDRRHDKLLRKERIRHYILTEKAKLTDSDVDIQKHDLLNDIWKVLE